MVLICIMKFSDGVRRWWGFVPKNYAIQEAEEKFLGKINMECTDSSVKRLKSFA